VSDGASALHIAWAKLFLRAAWHAGVREVVLSPGSRSTPLAIAAHESPELRTEIVVDERSAAFFALGQARVTGRPTVLACTSGTAAAHYFPAIIEASMSGVPLIALTADRPWELQQTGASQTIDQVKLFGGFVRAFFALGAPEPHEGALRAAARIAAQAVSWSMGPHPGPVHVNVPFRKPLEPHPGAASDAWRPLFDVLMSAGPTRALDARTAVDPAAVAEVARLLIGAPRGLVACGPAPAHGDLAAYRREITAMAAALGFPILAEATSQMRFGAASPARASASAAAREGAPGAARDTAASSGSGRPCAVARAVTPATSLAGEDVSAPPRIATFDALLRSKVFRARHAPDVIVEIGAPLTSAGYAQLLAENSRCRRVVIAPAGWSDPASTATLLVHADVTAFCHALRMHLTTDRESPGREADPAPPPAGSRAPHAGTSMSLYSYSMAFAAADERARGVVDAIVTAGAGALLTEAAVARAVVEGCPAGSVLVLGNSSPVRDVDAYVPPSPRPLRVVHQRGASGIDGLVSVAAGAQHASGSPVTLLLGDLSLLHDIGGLLAARAVAGPLVIVAVNNGGGRIFEQLPIGRALGPGGAFERLFATPRPVDLAAAAAAFGVAFARAAAPDELRAALTAAHHREGATLVEATVPPHDGAARHRRLWTDIDELLSPRKDAVS
jgi:2-succinyl-5-enolpyruvyl-6-hydroxy-3-cyclohexene-1-carboxylate synthase